MEAGDLLRGLAGFRDRERVREDHLQHLEAWHSHAAARGWRSRCRGGGDMGHADTKILRRYQDVVAELKKEAASAMDQRLG